jgi:hypothetical protein
MFFCAQDLAISFSLRQGGRDQPLAAVPDKKRPDRSISVGPLCHVEIFCHCYGSYMAFTVPEIDYAAITPRIAVMRAFTGNNPFPYMLHFLENDY